MAYKTSLNTSLLIVFLALIFHLQIAESKEQPDISIYGSLPAVDSVSISPDGKHISLIQEIDGQDYFTVRNSHTFEAVGAVKAKNIKARDTQFASNKHVLFFGSDTMREYGYRNKWEQSGALAYNLETKKLKLLLKNTEDIHPVQSGLGWIVGLNSKEEVLYMPAYQDGGSPPYNLYRVDLNSGKGKIHARGKPDTIDWFVGEGGRVLAKEEYDKAKKEHKIYSKVSGKWELIFSQKTDVPKINIQAVDSNEQSLIYIAEQDNHDSIYKIDLETGAINGPIYSKPETDVQFLKTDLNRKLEAIVYSGFLLDYEFIDSIDNKNSELLNQTFNEHNIEYRSLSSDRSKLIVKVSGPRAAGDFYLFDTKARTAKLISSSYKVKEIAEIRIINYRARDQLKIPAILTLPKNKGEIKNLPLIALPHGGPESYDGIKFDWLAQYFAAKGYAVLQPNFRGSTGFGYEFRNAGRGKWGREMQDDVTDGVKALVEAGYIDPNRVCIIGASYGGYSALAGAAFTPELYKCVISINGVSDIPAMLKSNRNKYGPNHWVVSYWRNVIGDMKTEKVQLENISPANYANNFQAPVLLIHGKDDTIVPLSQSKMMEKALKKANKTVQLTKLRGEDHWLSTSASRQSTLKKIDAFLDKYNPVE